MRVLLQQVEKASVRIGGEIVSSIGKGYLLLVAFTHGDDKAICEKTALKLSKARTFPDENGKTNLSLSSVNGEILSVSQFTLYGSLKEGNRPAFVDSMKAEGARDLYSYFNDCLRQYFPSLQTGVFQADMKVELVNDGPFTLILDSEELFK